MLSRLLVRPLARYLLLVPAMSEGLNLVTLIGNLGADPELTQTAGGPLLRMRLATTEVYFDKENNRKERTEWHSVKTWGRQAEGLAKTLSKGTRVFVKGRLSTSSYDKGGEKRYRTDVVATDVLYGGRTAPSPAHEPSSAELPF
jgi:single-strand DNA-binding protein